MTDAPMSAEQLNAVLGELVPPLAQLGVRFIELRPGFVRARLPFEGNGNHFGAVYAGSIFGLAEVLGGALHYGTFDTSTHFPLVRSLTIDFLRAGTGPLTATAELTAEEIARIRAESTPGAKVAYEVRSEVHGEDGTLVATTRGDYQLRPLA